MARSKPATYTDCPPGCKGDCDVCVASRLPALPIASDNEPIGQVTMQLVRCADGSLGLQWERAGHRVGFVLPHGAQAWARDLVLEQSPDNAPTVRKQRNATGIVTARKRHATAQ